MNGHHLILGEIEDFLTGEKLVDETAARLQCLMEMSRLLDFL